MDKNGYKIIITSPMQLKLLCWDMRYYMLN